MNDERLRQILRQGDPAGEGGGLTPDEARALRRTVLTAIPERKRRLLPVLALAGALATAALIAVLLLRPEPVKAPAPPSRIATAPPVAQAPVPPAPRPAPKEAEPRPVHHRHHPRSRVPAAPAIPEVHDTLASLETAEPERQVQFSTPGGTRIIWILKSGKTSH
jgi:hypothetical protein